MFKSQADYLITEHPHLSAQIQTGLLLAIAGRVKPVGDTALALIRNWKVLGETYEERDEEMSVVSSQTSASPSPLGRKTYCKTYMVRDLDTTPRRWICNCEQGSAYGPRTADFLGHTSRICKHIAAVAICWLECDYMSTPASLWELVTRLVAEQAVYLAAGEAVELPTPHKIKLEYYDKNGQSGLCLKTGRARSDVLVRWMPIEKGGEWRLVGEAELKYKAFVSKINGGSNG